MPLSFGTVKICDDQLPARRFDTLINEQFYSIDTIDQSLDRRHN